MNVKIEKLLIKYAKLVYCIDKERNKYFICFNKNDTSIQIYLDKNFNYKNNYVEVFVNQTCYYKRKFNTENYLIEWLDTMLKELNESL